MYLPQQIEAVLAAARDVILNEDNDGLQRRPHGHFTGGL